MVADFKLIFIILISICVPIPNKLFISILQGILNNYTTYMYIVYIIILYSCHATSWYTGQIYNHLPQAYDIRNLLKLRDNLRDVMELLPVYKVVSNTLICSSKSALRASFITSIWRTISPESRRFTTVGGGGAGVGGGGDVFL